MSEQLASTDPSSKPPCKYGSKCYRKNPTHFAQFSHPGTPCESINFPGKGSLNYREQHDQHLVQCSDSSELEGDQEGPTRVDINEDTRPPSPKRSKLDQDDVVVLDQPSEAPEMGHKNPDLVVLDDDDDNDDSEVRRKPGSGEREGAEGISPEIVKSTGTESEDKVNRRSLFYLTKVRGIGAHHNRPDMAIGIKGERNQRF